MLLTLKATGDEFVFLILRICATSTVKGPDRSVRQMRIPERRRCYATKHTAEAELLGLDFDGHDGQFSVGLGEGSKCVASLRGLYEGCGWRNIQFLDRCCSSLVWAWTEITDAVGKKTGQVLGVVHTWKGVSFRRKGRGVFFGLLACTAGGGFVLYGILGLNLQVGLSSGS